jgi:hypothetical protein
MQALRNVCHLENTKVLFLIDGLDKYYPHESHRLLIEDLEIILRLPNVKICVSSRPWPIFENAFNDCVSIKLHDFNRQDIYQYAQSEIRNAADESMSVQHPSDLDVLATRITALASGVFLWVHLAVSALAERLRAGSNMEQLLQCLYALPKDLEDYFYDMIYQRIAKTWREGSETAAVLKLATLLQEPDSVKGQRVPLWGSFLYYWFISQSNDFQNPDFAFDFQVKLLSNEDIIQMLRHTQKFLNHCARDLLQIDNFKYVSHANIDFTHRSVYDFLITDRMQKLLDEHTLQNFWSKQFQSHLGTFPSASSITNQSSITLTQCCQQRVPKD